MSIAGALACALAVSLSACQSGDFEAGTKGGKRDPAPAETTPVTKNTTPPAPRAPEMPPEAKKQTSDGAKAFVEYYYAMYDYSRKKRDFTEFKKLASEGCSKCAQQAGAPEDAYFSQGGDVRVAKLPKPDLPIENGKTGLGVNIEQTAGAFVAGSGQKPQQMKAQKWVDTLFLKYVEGSWIVERID